MNNLLSFSLMLSVVLGAGSWAKSFGNTVGCYLLWSTKPYLNSVTNTKFLAFPTTSPVRQAEFERGLEAITETDLGSPLDQCSHGCAAFSIAGWIELSAPREERILLSGGYLAATSLLHRFGQLLIDELRDFNPGTRFSEVFSAIGTYGVVTEEAYPSLVNVDFLKLHSLLVELRRQHFAALNFAALKLVNEPDEKSLLFRRSILQAYSLIEGFFGKFPSQEALRSRQHPMPLDLARTALRVMSKASRQSHFSASNPGDRRIDPFDLLSLLYPLLNSGTPLLVSFSFYESEVNSSGLLSLRKTVSEEAHFYHGALVLGIFKDRESGQYYVKIKNSHQNAPILYASFDFVRERFLEVYSL